MEEQIKKNLCNKDGFCDAECLEDQKECRFFSPAQTLFPGQCVFLMFKGNCQNPEALVAKWEEIRAQEEIAAAAKAASQ